MATALCIFAKAPVAGTVKTRLAAGIGEKAALEVYQHLLRITAAQATLWPGPTVVFGAGDLTILADSPLGCFPCLPQHPGNLGERLQAGLTTALTNHDQAIAIGTDCPGLSTGALTAVEQHLRTHAVCFAPSGDGGYWALGLSQQRAVDCCCAASLPWSQSTLLSSSIDACTTAGLSHILGPQLDDVDTQEDLRQAQKAGLLTNSELTSS